MTALRVLAVHGYPWDCGPHRCLLEWIGALDRQMIEPIVAVQTDRQAVEFSQLDCDVIRVPRFSAQGVGRVRSVTAIPALAQTIWRSAPDAVYVNSETAVGVIVASRLLGVPIVVHSHTVSLARSRTASLVLGALFRWSRAEIVAVCRAGAALAVAAGVPPGRVRVVNNGIRSDLVAASDGARARQSLGLTPRERLIVSVGGLDPRKGQVYLVEAARTLAQRFPNLRVVIAGAPSPVAEGREYEAEVQRRISSLALGDIVRLVGHRDDVGDLLAAADVVVQPSLTEANPRVVLEAMALGRPVVATAVGGTPEVIRHLADGLLVAPQDPAAIADSVAALLSSVDLSSRLGAAAAQAAERFSLSGYVSSLSAAVLDTAQSRASRADSR